MSKSKYFAVVTDLGNELMLKAVADGVKVNICTFAVGDGNGAYYEPQTTMTQLKAEKWRGDINSCEISKVSENVLIVSALCPGDVGGFTIREMAVFDDQDRMIAICNTPDTPKVKITEGVVNEMRLELEIVLINGASVELVIDPNIVTATKKDVEGIWDYLKENGKVVVGKKDLEIEENDICVVVDEVNWPEKKVYLLTGGTGYGTFYPNKAILKSNDGTTWMSIPNEENEISNFIYSMAYGNGLFIGLISSNKVKLCKSNDGETWVIQDMNLERGSNWSIIFAYDSFILFCDNGIMYRSKDGIVWNELGSNNFRNGNIFSCNNIVFATERNGIWKLTEDMVWEKVHTQSFDYDDYVKIVFANGKFVCLKSFYQFSSNTIYYSEDGIKWRNTSVPICDIFTCNNVFWGYRAYGNHKVILRSNDALTWEELEITCPEEIGKNNNGSVSIAAIYFVDNLYYGIISNASSFYLCISNDGIEWDLLQSNVPIFMTWNF